jgi:NAD(P)H dehydrogenase (quinone)
MILITGASGKTGTSIFHAVSRLIDPQLIRVLVRRQEQAAPFSDEGVKEIVIGDMKIPDTWKAAVEGVSTLYHICPNMSPDEIAIGEKAILAAKNAGVHHFIYHSVLHPQVEEMAHHWNKLRVEELLFKSGLGFTILQPAAYMQNVLAQKTKILEKGVYPVPYAAHTRLGMVDLEDVAEVAARILTEPGHAGAIYELAGGQVLDQNEIALIIGLQLNKTIKVEEISREIWKQRSISGGLSAFAVETLVKMFNYYEESGFYGNPRVLEMLLKRKPSTFEGFVGRSF